MERGTNGKFSGRETWQMRPHPGDQPEPLNQVISHADSVYV